MKQRSLHFRLLVAAVISVSAALVIAGIGLVTMFERHVERRIGLELDTYLNQITAAITISSNGRIAFTGNLADPRFSEPLSGLYWQVKDEERRTLLRSRSLWDHAIELPEDQLDPGIVHEHHLAGPAGQAMMVRERQVLLPATEGERRIRVAVAVNRHVLVDARNAFAADMWPYLAVLAVVLLLAAWIQVRAGLAPLDAVRRGVAAIRSGAARHLEPVYPVEVMPLVDEMNGLLEAREQAVQRAREWTADLAHGLKTPLTVLTADSRRLREDGHTTIADDLEQLAETMRRRVDRELVRARVRSSIGQHPVHADVADVISGIVRALQRTPRGSVLRWAIDAPAGVRAAMAPEDLAELVGNVLENATKWARAEIAVSVELVARIAIRVEDDGPGVPAAQLDALGERGLRLDERKQGSGLGLAIARDVCEAYHGSLAFATSRMGGLAVTIEIPGVE